MIKLQVRYGLYSWMLAMLLSGCSTVDILSGGDKKFKDHHLYDRQGINILVENSNLKTTVIKDKDSLERICRSPNPDFAAGQTAGVSLGIGQGPSIGTSSGAMIDSLGGRSPAVLITRELMYRACELSLNLQANPDLSKEIYWRFLSTVELAIKSQSGPGVQSTSITSNTNAPSTFTPPSTNPIGTLDSGYMPPFGGTSAVLNGVTNGQSGMPSAADSSMSGGVSVPKQ